MSDPPPIRLALQDEHWVVAVKPAGLSTVAPPGGDSLESRLRIQLDRRGDYLAAVHRLDRETTGLVAVALTKRAARSLSDQFAHGQVVKQYVADSAPVDSPVGTHFRWVDRLQKRADQPVVDLVAAGVSAQDDDQDGKLAETSATVIEHAAAMTRWRLEPRTGRTHQLRVQMAHRGHPILGDPVYGKPSNATITPEMRLFAVSLALRQPITLRSVEVRVDDVAPRLT